ncbi:hypothetical protein E1B28_013656 [Marasmius oreades]|uniref:Uncharacterized protein n=1 Tax=Marasmius oreades TaxID=181124 RepID=A0A9P7UQ44_9AGAR|nr:uncharacterized protein E1B28_013656 [Marasmius oreades]KAG7087709.1 hypothetical protein E1B28_013656 [Marasmius oreades]
MGVIRKRNWAGIPELLRVVFYPQNLANSRRTEMGERICSIPGNADIAGVRASVYIQACLAALNTAFMMNTVGYGEDDDQEEASQNVKTDTVTTNPPAVDRPQSPKEHPFPNFLRNRSLYIGVVKNLERSIFMVGFAVIISAIIEMRTSPSGLTPYHALIVLNISLINNWAGLLILMGRGGFRMSGRRGWKGMLVVTRASILDSFWCIVHSTLFCAFGLYFWGTQSAFLGYLSEQSDPCQPLIYYWVFGPVAYTNRALKVASLVFYSISVLPVAGLYFQVFVPSIILLTFIFVFAVLPVAGIIGMVLATIFYCIIQPFFNLLIRPIFRIPLMRRFLDLVAPTFVRVWDYLRTLSRTLSAFTTSLVLGPAYAPIVMFIAALAPISPIIYTIVSTESIVKLNRPNVLPGENVWTYGQTLALFTAAVACVLYGYEWWKTLKEERMWLERKGDAETGGSGSPAMQSHSERETQTENVVDT